MKELKDLLTTLRTGSEPGFEPLTPEERVRREVDEYNAESGEATLGYDCPECNNRQWFAAVRKAEGPFGYFYMSRYPCKCQKTREAIRRLNRSGLENVVEKYSLERYQTPEPWQQTIKDKAMRFLKDDKNRWFFMGGQSGAGKSHICSAIAVQYIREGKEVKYMLWRDEITRIKAAVNESDQYGDLMRPLKQSEVLYIDDLFKSGKGDDGRYKPPTAADVNAAFEIINYRYNNPELVTIISSERTLVELNEIDEAIAGRIAEKTKDSGYCINLRKDASRNWRMRGLGEI